MSDSKSAPQNSGNATKKVPTVNWDDSNMSTSYSNVVNAVSSREEFTLFFGTNETWNAQDAAEINVKLSDRVILNPHAAKRLLTLLAGVMQEYEKRFGEVNINLSAALASQIGGSSGGDGKSKPKPS